MTIEQTVNLDFAIKQYEEVVLIVLISRTFTAHELYIFLKKQFLIQLKLKVCINGLPFKQCLI